MTDAATFASGKGHRDENFPVASWLVRRELRAPMLAFYRFARAADDVADHADAVVTEAVSNAVRHAQATGLTVRMCVNHRLTIDVIDDGCGIPADNARRSGLANMARRASQVGGQCSITAAPEGGTRVCWSAPLS